MHQLLFKIKNNNHVFIYFILYLIRWKINREMANSYYIGGDTMVAYLTTT